MTQDLDTRFIHKIHRQALKKRFRQEKLDLNTQFKHKIKHKIKQKT